MTSLEQAMLACDDDETEAVVTERHAQIASLMHVAARMVVEVYGCDADACGVFDELCAVGWNAATDTDNDAPDMTDADIDAPN